MSSLKRIIITLLCLVAACACYLFGMEAGGTLFLVAGVVFEGLFWFRVLPRKKPRAYQ